jgi:SdrD B-like domain/Domain of unknown function DUF11
MTRHRTPRLAAAVLLCATALAFTEWRPRAAGTISGVVFEDFNGNGLRDLTTTIPNDGGVGDVSAAVDRGVGNVTVTVYDSAGLVQGTALTAAATGAYSIVTTGSTGPYRVEFTTLPPGYQPTKFAAGATGNGTTVQFVPDGDSPNINLGILDPANFCANNPTLVISCYVFGNQTSPPNNVLPVLVDFPYSAGASGNGQNGYFQPTDHTLMVPAQSIGTTYGLAYSRPANTLYSGAFMKKHADFGPGGTGAIYAVNPSAPPGGAPVLFADLNTLFGGTGANPHDPTNYNTDNGNLTWNAVGKISLGGLEVSPDGAFVYVVNLFDRHVYRLPTGAGTPQRVPVPVPAGVVPGDVRPFALQYYKGLLYVGLVDSAESTQNAASLRAFVYTLDPVSLAFSPSPVFEVPLNYPRGAVQLFNGTSSGAWLPWTSGFATNWSGSPGAFGDNVGTYPQPWLTSLAFDVDGNMILGLRDRAGDQFGYYALSNPADSFLWLGISGGDTLFAEANVKGNPGAGWTLETNSQTPGFGPTGGAGNNQGPGGGEYFFQDNYLDLFSPLEFHQETNQGALLQLPGFPDVVSSSMNPGRNTNTGGVMWMSRVNPTQGAKTKGYNLYSTPGVPDTFSKTNGLGEMVAICQAAPIEIGNRVWDDLDGDGVQDAGEPGLDGVTVQLIAPGGAVLASVVTANGGQYYFSSQTIAGLTPSTAGYVVRITGGQPALGGRNLTIANSDATANGDSRDSDASTVLGNAEIVVATGPAGFNNHTYDFGYTSTPQTLSLGNFVWYDTNNNGVVDASEQPITGVDVVLYSDNGNGTFDALTDTVVATQTTAAGLYLFTGLAPGNYFVQIPALEFGSGQTLFGYLNSTGQNAGDVDNVDHGAPAPVVGQGIVSNLVTLTVGGEPGVPVDGDGTNSNLTIDFGFYKLSLGNFVFFDNDNSGTVTAGDTPAAGRPVELLNNVGAVLQTTSTDAAGLYSFSGLTPGDYAVRITPPNGFASSTGPASAFEPGPDPDNNVDNDDNGTNAVGITSALITLTPGAEIVNDNATGETSNPTVDFGLIPIGLSLGNYVWLDANNDGIAQPTETGINGVTVRLFNGNGTVQLNQMVTAGGGFYLFTNLAPGDYVVEVVIPPGLTSSTGTPSAYEPAPDPDNNINNDDNGTTQTGNVVVRSLPVTLASNTEPVDDGDTDANSNLTVDFGFFSNQPPSLCLGNLVWLDLNNNGIADPGETGIPGVTLRLIGADGVTVIATTTTDANGNYQFCGLQPGTYFVEVDRTSTGVAGLPSSTDIVTSGNPDNDTDNDDNGVNLTATTVRSNAVTLDFNTEPDTPVDGDGTNSNLTVDFGFVPLLSLGNLVWADDVVNDNALVDPGELGIPNIPVRLIAADGTTLLASTTTNANGNYLFTGLQPGDYFVEITAPVAAAVDQSSSTDIASSADPNNDRDNDDNGLGVAFGNGTTGVVVRSARVTLTLGGEPVNDGDTNPYSNLTVDFGIPGGGSGQTTACLAITALPKSIQAGAQFTSTFATENIGPFPAKNVMIEGMLPQGLNVVATTPSPGGTCTLVGSDLTCTWPGLTAVGPAARRTVDVTFVTNLPAGTPVWLWFMTENGNPAPGSEACAVVDGYPFVVDGTGSTDLAITAVAASSSQLGSSVAAQVNEPVRARFAVTNLGTTPARGRYEIQIDNAGGLNLMSATVTQGQAAATGPNTGAWETNFIVPGDTAQLDLTFLPTSSGVTKVTAIRHQRHRVVRHRRHRRQRRRSLRRGRQRRRRRRGRDHHRRRGRRGGAGARLLRRRRTDPVVLCVRPRPARRRARGQL